MERFSLGPDFSQPFFLNKVSFTVLDFLVFAKETYISPF